MADAAFNWLHISDLHFRATSDNYDSQVVLRALHAAAAASKATEFAPDVVFVTGDIAFSGRQEEYVLATKFFDDLLSAIGLPKERLLVVPGNHDVDRRVQAGLIRTLANGEQADAFFGGEHPRHHLRKLDAYRAWHDSYFGTGTRPIADGVSPAPVIMEVNGVGVAVVLLNSAIFCAEDDDHGKLWLGRRWLRRCVEVLDAAAVELTIGLIHHPLSWLHEEERTNIEHSVQQRFDVLLRGHLHDNESESRFTGTRGVVHLAAGASYQTRQWPNRALFVRADVGRRLLRVRPIRYEDKPIEAFTIDPTMFHAEPDHVGRIPLKATLPTELDGSPSYPSLSVGRAESHWRRATVETATGISIVEVELKDVSLGGTVALAVATPPFCRIEGAPHAQTDAGALEVAKQTLPDGREWFGLHQVESPLANLTWHYRSSNAFALTHVDVTHLEHRDAWLPNIEGGYFGRPHVLRFSSKTLLLEHVFDADVIEHAKPIVEKWSDEDGRPRWVRDRVAEDRCKVEHQPRRATLEVTRPALRHRYTLAYRPAPSDPLLDPSEVRFADHVVEASRNAPSGTSSFADTLTGALSAPLETVFGGPFGKRTSWMGLLWKSKPQRLLATFGRFPNRSWSVRFRYGYGVAGHAFRFRCPAAWFADDLHPSRSLIFQLRTEVQTEYGDDYKWVVAMPIYTRPDGPVLGVVSIAGAAPETPADEAILGFAQDANENPASEHAMKKRNELFTAVNTSFWATASESTFLLEKDRAFATAILKHFV